MNLLVRADFYPNGIIIPLCVTFPENNKSVFIKNVKIKDITPKYTLFDCVTNEESICLKLEGSVWTLM